MSFPLFERYVKNDWVEALKPEFECYKSFYESFSKNIEKMYAEKEAAPIFPAKENIFKAFALTSLKNVKVVILGQDPYPNDNACGLSFSIKKGRALTKSLKNISKELFRDVNYFIPENNGCLERWAEQGVLLLNTVLTVGKKRGSHSHIGWQIFTDAVIKTLNEQPQKKVFILWGKEAFEKKCLITINKRCRIIYSSHPSPLSSWKGFTAKDGTKVPKFSHSFPFSKSSEILGCSNEKLWRL